MDRKGFLRSCRQAASHCSSAATRRAAWSQACCCCDLTSSARASSLVFVLASQSLLLGALASSRSPLLAPPTPCPRVCTLYSRGSGSSLTIPRPLRRADLPQLNPHHRCPVIVTGCGGKQENVDHSSAVPCLCRTRGRLVDPLMQTGNLAFRGCVPLAPHRQPQVAHGLQRG